MTSAEYVKKAVLQFSKGQEENALDSLQASLASADEDLASAVDAHCILGKYWFIHQQFRKSWQHLTWITVRTEKLEQLYDDFLHDEINTAQVLLEVMEEFALLK